MDRPIPIQETKNGVMLKIFVQPKSSKNMVVGQHGDALKIKLTAPPVDGAANKMCIKFLSKLLGVSKSALEIKSGHTSRTKRIVVAYPEKTDSDSKKKAFSETIIKKCLGKIKKS